MNSNGLPGPARIAWRENRHLIIFITALLLLLSVLKILFYWYNRPYLNGTGNESLMATDLIRIAKWSLLTDLSLILLINIPFVLLLLFSERLPKLLFTGLIIPLFSILNGAMILLNLADVFYFPFHFQRANADLFFSIEHPVQQLLDQHLVVIIAITGSVALTLTLCWSLTSRLYRSFVSGRKAVLLTITILLLISAGYLTRFFDRRIVPTFPMVELKSNQLLVAQNSMHTFLYSVLRRNQSVQTRNDLTAAECDSLLPLRKRTDPVYPASAKKNIVLFIMESVPYDFFDTASPYKVAMPFFDALLKKSVFFNRAYCFSHQSNKGITAILAGVPTLTDVPLYHSAYVNLPITRLGGTLKQEGYHSLFCIGDAYDNFGFAKCANWLGFDQYLSMEDIPGHDRLPKHTMGIQDEYVLDFFRNTLDQEKKPFLAVHYNVSTHYPYDLPGGFDKGLPASYTAPMKSMRYYDQSLGKFFEKASRSTWFSNTVFLFCSDHWLVPDDRHTAYNALSGYRIPIILYDPSVNEPRTVSYPVSQFDIPGTILSLAGYRDGYISYGSSLLQAAPDPVVYARASAGLYHCSDSAYILGYNSITNKAEFLYHFTKDPGLKQNLLKEADASTERMRLTLHMKAFLQKAVDHYNGKPVK